MPGDLLLVPTTRTGADIEARYGGGGTTFTWGTPEDRVALVAMPTRFADFLTPEPAPNRRKTETPA